MNNFKKPFLIVLVAALLPMASITTVRADDTDVYLTGSKIKRDDAPNVLIIFDNSGSMETNSVSSRAAYDPTHTYTPASYNTSRVYWNTGSGKPSTSTDQWIDATNNKCESSFTNLGTTAGATGYYASDRIVQWRVSSTDSSKGRWRDLSGGRNTEIECQADDPAQAGTGGKKYVQATSSNISYTARYTDTAGSEISWSSYGLPTLYSGNYLNYLTTTTDPVAAYSSKTRIELGLQAMRTIINSNINVNMGLMVFNRNDSTPNGGRVVARIKKLDAAWKTSLTNTTNEIRGYVNPGASFGSGSTSNYTPLAETLWEAYRYLSGSSVAYGGSGWYSNSGSDANYPRPYPDICAEDDTNPAYCANYDYATVDRDDITSWYGSATTGTYKSPFKFECQQSYIIVITDGDPSNDTSANSSIDGLAGMKAYDTPTTGGTTADNIGGNNWRMDDLAGWMYDNDMVPNSSLKGFQRAITYTVGFGSGISANGKALLQKTADAGHGKYYETTDADTLATALQSTLTDIQTTSTSFAAPSLSVNAFNKLYNRDEIYFALFKPSTSVHWEGNIKKLHLCNTQDMVDHGCTYGEIIDANGAAAIDAANLRIKDTSVSYWNSVADGGTVTEGGAGLSIKNQSAARKVYTYLDTYANLTTANNVVEVTNSTSDPVYTAAVADYTLLDNTATINGMVDAPTKNAAVLSLINWMLGKTYNDAAVKRWPFGDPLHSRPVALTLGAENDIFGNPDLKKPIVKLFVATNDGQIHILNDSTGQEEWAFIPKELLGMQYTLSQDQDAAHPYGADAPPSFWVSDINNDGIIDPIAGDKIYMYIGMRRGGRNIYAFDMTPAAKITSQSTALSPKLVWVIEGGVTTGYDRLGQTWSMPLVRDIRMKCTGTGCNAGDSKGKTVLMFAGGYDKDQDVATYGATAPSNPSGEDDGVGDMGNTIYIVDPLTGAKIWSAGSNTGNTLVLSEMVYSIPSDLTALDTNGDTYVDRIYVGDMGGLVWRIDLGKQLESGVNGGTKGYVLADLVCKRNTSNARVCTDTGFTTNQSWRKVFYPPDVAQMRDTLYSSTPDYDIVVVSTGNRADPLDQDTISAKIEAMHNRAYAIRDFNYATGPYSGTTAPVALTAADWQDLTANPLQDDTATGYAAALSALQTSKGWYVNYKEPTGSGVTVEPLASPATTEWIGEKGLAKPVIFDGVIYVTTYIPPNEVTASVTCAATEGLGKIYGLGILNAAAVVDLDGDGTPDRDISVGGGIPSELVTVIRDGGVTGLVGTSGGAASPNINSEQARGKTFWYSQ
jgi:type IV pilus assembly protein PilY1